MFYFFTFLSHPSYDQEQRRGGQAESTVRVSYSSILINFGKCLLLIVIVPPFLNYASLQREGQVLLPKGILSYFSREHVWISFDSLLKSSLRGL